MPPCRQYIFINISFAIVEIKSTQIFNKFEAKGLKNLCTCIIVLLGMLNIFITDYMSGDSALFMVMHAVHYMCNHVVMKGTKVLTLGAGR